MSRPLGDNVDRDLERALARELLALLDGVTVGSVFAVDRADPICGSLEFYLPHLLLRRYAEWARESLDGFFFAPGRKTHTAGARLTGTCILISDQAVTPFLAEITADASGTRIHRARVCIGEPGAGSLGISGPPCGSRAATGLLESLPGRIDAIPWVYRAELP
jgi:hypothetical protein